MTEELFFNGWVPLLRIVIVGCSYYVSLILLLRAAGKRTLSRMNGYDMVITMGIGSIMAKALLTKDISLSESLVATLLLVLLQYGLSVAMVHFSWVRKLVTAQPSVLYHNGKYIESVLKKERVDRDEIKAALHDKGISNIAFVEAVILGANGQLSVLLKPEYLNMKSETALATRPTGEI